MPHEEIVLQKNVEWRETSLTLSASDQQLLTRQPLRVGLVFLPPSAGRVTLMPNLNPPSTAVADRGIVLTRNSRPVKLWGWEAGELVRREWRAIAEAVFVGRVTDDEFQRDEQTNTQFDLDFAATANEAWRLKGVKVDLSAGTPELQIFDGATEIFSEALAAGTTERNFTGGLRITDGNRLRVRVEAAGTGNTAEAIAWAERVASEPATGTIRVWEAIFSGQIQDT